MNAPANLQILKDAKGKPTFAVIPYAEYISLSKQHAPTIPNAVVNKVINKDMTPIRAWREHLSLTQSEVARRLGVSQSAYAQQEAKEPVRKSTREKIANALGIVPEQLTI
ncbi:MAG: transcriptional regulator [Betaproteobacteria bacterium RBG_16_56_24]|nr:MAG: transcriptional regulator [Betaproteobacteria bacterium RBG_16_56_24]